MLKKRMTWQETAQDYYDHHETMTEENRAWLKANVAFGLTQLLDDLTREQILALGVDPVNHHFSSARLVRTLVWETLARVICEDVTSPCDNLRSFWYAFVDPLFSKFNLYGHLEQDPDYARYLEHLEDNPAKLEMARGVGVSKSYTQDLNEDAHRDFVVQGIYRYQGPFLFLDNEAQYKLIGTKNSSLIFVTEKHGLFSRARLYHAKYGITVMASQGYPSWVSFEYLADQLKAKRDKNIRVSYLTDLDPDGAAIAEDYRTKFETFGFVIKTNTMLTNLDLFTEETLATKADSLEHCGSKGAQKKADEWFAATGGIHGRKAGIHVNLADFKRVDAVVDRWFQANKPK